jgi:hypothetical protein
MCVNLIPEHTYYEHSILAYKPGVTAYQPETSCAAEHTTIDVAPYQ